MKVIIIIIQQITIQFAVRVRKDCTPLHVYLHGLCWVVIYVEYITYEGLLHNTLALDVDAVQERCILWAQYVDRPDSWIALQNLWILTSRRNPWIAQGSCLRDLWILPNFAYTTNRAGIHGSRKVVACAICGFCQILRILQIIILIPHWRRHIIWIDW